MLVGLRGGSFSVPRTGELEYSPSRNLCVYEALRERMCRIFPSLRSPSAHKRALALIGRAYERYRFKSCLEAAVVSVGDFQLDKTALLRDERMLQACGGDLCELARRYVTARRAQRCYPARVEACISLDNPQRALLLQFAAQGVDVRPLLLPEFVHNGPVVNALLAKGFHAAGLAAIVPTASIASWAGCNVSSSGWAPKPTGPDPVTGAWKPNNGWPTFNPKLLNLPLTKANADAVWGEVHHPNAESIAQMLVEFHDKQLVAGGHGWEDLEMWKILSDDGREMTMMYTCGRFGSSFQPAAFDLMFRAGRHELPQLIHSKGDGYVDDLYGVALRWLCSADMEAVKGFFRALLGKDALRGRSNRYSTITLSPLARMAVHMLRALTLLMGVDEPNFSRPLDSWVPPTCKTGIVAELDGCLSGLVLLFFAASADGSERLVGVSEVDVRCLGFAEDSGWQNVCEYIATTAATKGASMLSKRGRADKISRRAEGSLSLRELVDSDPGMAGAEIIDLHMEQE
ncbi:hypothetical protein B484DRAFT_406879, partial [Ochromonadaceae sp. CCMP2298]